MSRSLRRQRTRNFLSDEIHFDPGGWHRGVRDVVPGVCDGYATFAWDVTMTERVFHVCDTLATGLITGVTTMASVLLASVRPYDSGDVLWLTLLPAIGAAFTFSGAVLLNPRPETRNIVIGRAFFGAFVGITMPGLSVEIVPNVIPESWGWIVKLLQFPLALIGMGGVAALAGYVLSRPFCARLYERSDAIAAAQVKKIEELAKGPNNTVIVLDPGKVTRNPPSEK